MQRSLFPSDDLPEPPPPRRAPGLSKSRLLAYRQCVRRLYLEVHRRELVRYPASTRSAFDRGHEVGRLARRLYDDGTGRLVESRGGGAIATTRALVADRQVGVVFEGAFRHAGVVVRVDALIRGERGHRLVEVKSSTSLKDEHIVDCAVQAWVLRNAGVRLTGVSLAHIDTGFVYGGNGDYAGLLLERDLTDAVEAVLEEVPGWVEAARELLAGPEPTVPVGSHCTRPYECPLIHHCWPVDAEYPVSGLGGSRALLGELIAEGYRDIREIPPGRLRSAQHVRIWETTCAASPRLEAAAIEFGRDLDYPRYYLDFETIAATIPFWPGTRPYETLPIQWSCHIEPRAGVLEQREFLDVSGAPPLRPLADSLLEALGTTGPVLTYTGYERRVLTGLAERFPDLAAPMRAVIDRLIDLHPVTRDHYYDPAMLGSWSIKAVLPTVTPGIGYGSLGEIREGSAASDAYLEAIAAHTTPARRETLRRQLLEYCRFDTLAMVRLLHFFASGGQPQP